MKSLVLVISLLFIATQAFSQNANYDQKLADSLGADEMGMKPYILVILKTGTNNTTDKAIRDSLFKGHFANINKLAEEGKLVVAGPIGKNEKTYRGIFILNVKTVEEARALLENDPTIKEKIFDLEFYNWYGSAAMQKLMEIHKKIDKTQH